jgi:hypothetical protein
MFYLKSYSCLDSSWLFEHEEILNDKYLNSKVLHLVEIYNFRIIFSTFEFIWNNYDFFWKCVVLRNISDSLDLKRYVEYLGTNMIYNEKYLNQKVVDLIEIYKFRMK